MIAVGVEQRECGDGRLRPRTNRCVSEIGEKVKSVGRINKAVEPRSFLIRQLIHSPIEAEDVQ